MSSAPSQPPATAPVDHRRAERLSGAIYGQIVATSTVAGLSEYEGNSAPRLLGLLVATMLVFWLAHAYAELISRRVVGETVSLAAWRSILANEWTIVQAAGPPAAALGLGALGVMSRDDAVQVAIWVGVIALLAWGVFIGRRTGRSWLGTLVVAAISGGFGVAIILVKVLLH